MKHFLKGSLKGKLLAPKLRKSADKSLSQPGCSHSNTIYDVQLQKTIVLRMQPQRQATLTQPLPCISQHHVANLHVSTHITTPDDKSHAAIPMRSASTDSKTPFNYAHTHTQSSFKPPLHCGKKKKGQTDPSRNRRTMHTMHTVPTLLTIHTIHTSSTAQGGGGSFKNRMPIGEVGCCESRLAERSH